MFIPFSAWDESPDPGANWIKLEHMKTTLVGIVKDLDPYLFDKYLSVLKRLQGITTPASTKDSQPQNFKPWTIQPQTNTS